MKFSRAASLSPGPGRGGPSHWRLLLCPGPAPAPGRAAPSGARALSGQVSSDRVGGLPDAGAIRSRDHTAMIPGVTPAARGTTVTPVVPVRRR
eukprot:768487-Hanusia_phi.AAC.2